MTYYSFCESTLKYFLYNYGIRILEEYVEHVDEEDMILMRMKIDTELHLLRTSTQEDDK